MKNRQTGFTLVEIAIVLVIIGLLLGGVLKGQELIYSAKAKAIINDFRNVSVMINVYQDRFRALPGDDATVTAHLAGTTKASTAGQTQGNGIIEGTWDSVTTTDESYVAWQHLRIANLTSGPTVLGAVDYAPKNSEGGKIGIQSSRPAGTPAGPSIQGRIFVCQDQVTGRVAQQVDSTMDNGDITTGSVYVLKADSSGLAASPLTDDAFYIICAGF